MKKLKLYLETSVWNFLFADDAPDKKESTEKLFEIIKKGVFEVYISETVMAEIDEAGEGKRQQLLAVIKKFRPVILDVGEEETELTETYIKNGLLSDNHIEDLLHLATATVNNMNILVSWNLKHLVKHKTRMLTNAVNKKSGYREIDICRPEEVLEIGE